jgi:hypothetical protein
VSGQGLIFRMERAFHALERGCVAMRACVRNPSLRGSSCLDLMTWNSNTVRLLLGGRVGGAAIYKVARVGDP